MPDGHNYIEANQIVYKNVTRKHSGTYICEGSNGPGQIVTDKIQVDILRKKIISSLKNEQIYILILNHTMKFLKIFNFRSS